MESLEILCAFLSLHRSEQRHYYESPPKEVKEKELYLSDGGNISGAQTESLTISNVAAGDQAGYTLVVSNFVGAITSAPPEELNRSQSQI